MLRLITSNPKATLVWAACLLASAAAFVDQDGDTQQAIAKTTESIRMAKGAPDQQPGRPAPPPRRQGWDDAEEQPPPHPELAEESNAADSVAPAPDSPAEAPADGQASASDAPS